MSLDLPLNRDAVMAVIPHRDPMLFIDQVLAFDDTALKAKTFVDPTWPVFKGHFPEFPIMPGVLLIETIAQAGSLILGLNGQVPEGEFIGFTGVEAAKFRRAVKPNDWLDIGVVLVKARRGFFKFEGKVTVGGELAAEVKFAAAQMSL